MKILQDELEISITAEAVRRLKPYAIFEIGSANGGTVARWLRAGATHVVSLDADHSKLEWSELEQVKSDDQHIHLITGRSEDPDTIRRLDQTMEKINVERFDVAYIDGGHSYMWVKCDFVTCLPRVSKAIILNDPVMVDVGVFVSEILRTQYGAQAVSIVNPNRRLPCAGQHTCDSDYLAETGGGNCFVLLDSQFNDVLDFIRTRVENELVPKEKHFEPTRSYFHQRGLAESPEYEQYWSNLYPQYGRFHRWLYADAMRLYRESYSEQMRGRIEESLHLIKQAKRMQRRWHYDLIKRLARRFIKLD